MKTFHVYPAIDIKDGKCVRLLHGDFERETIYENNPVEQIEVFLENGCKWIHIVDLNATLENDYNKNIIKNIVKNFYNKINIQLGGGIRSYQDIKFWLELGVSRVVVGTLAFDNPEVLNSLDNYFHNKIALAVDVKNGKVATNGWQKRSNLNPIDLFSKLNKDIIDVIIYTDISRDGSLKGINFENTLEFANLTSLPVIASGGISSINEIKKLYDIKNKGIVGAIIGKALYEKKFHIGDVNRIIYNKV